MKNIRRMLAAFLCLTLVLPMAAPYGAAVEADEPTWDIQEMVPVDPQEEPSEAFGASDDTSFDFEHDTVGEAPQGWTVGGNGTDPATSWVKVLEEEDGNKFLAVSATKTGEDTQALVELPAPIEGEALVSLRLMFPDDASLNSSLPNSAGFHMYWGTGSQAAVSLMNTNTQLGHRPRESQKETKGLADLDLGRWYALDIRVDTEAQTYSVWLDGELLVRDASCRYEGSGSIGKLMVAAPTVKLTKVDEDEYTFRQPADDVTVRVVFTAVETEPEIEFSDVKDTDWFAAAVEYVVEKGLMQGVGADLFQPQGLTDRAMVVTILYRLEGEPAVTGGQSFPDVAPDTWYAEAVRWASSEGIVDGYADGTFGPTDPVTREQLAAILYRYAGKPVVEGESKTFADSDKISNWAVEAMDWAVKSGVLSGKGGDLLDPTGTATRAEVAQILMNFCENVK